MSFAKNSIFISVSLLLVLVPVFADRLDNILKLADELQQTANAYAEANYRYLCEIKREIDREDQLFLYQSFGFARQVEFFFRLLNDWKYTRSENYFRTNIFNSFSSLVELFYGFKGRSTDRYLVQMEKIVQKIETEFSLWPDKKNLAYLHLKYIKANDQTVYLIEKTGTARYCKRPFASLEALFRYNYQLNRGPDPWKYLEKLSPEELQEIPEGEPINLTFENLLVMSITKRQDRPVYLIKNGKKCPLSSPAALNRYGGWKAVYELPDEIIALYPQGDAVE